MKRKIKIGVIGGREASQEVLKLAEETGKEIARRGAVLICGGMSGVMEAACKGAKEANGTTVGILPTSSPDDTNPYVDIPIPTGMGVARNAIIINSCDGVIAIGGRYGTLSEIAFALQKGIPLVSLKSWNFEESIVQINSPNEAVDWIFKQIASK